MTIRFLAELQAPEISSFPNQTVFRGNLSVILYCNVSANPVASVTWTKDGQSVTIIPVQTAVTVDCQSRVNGYYRAERGPNTLVICEPNDSANSGRFTCTARNGLGTSSQDAYVNVQGMSLYSGVFSLFLVSVAAKNPLMWSYSATLPEYYLHQQKKVGLRNVFVSVCGNFTCIIFSWRIGRGRNRRCTDHGYHGSHPGAARVPDL